MQVAPSGGQICNKCKWCHLVAKFGTNASCAIWWPNLELMQVEPPLAGEITQALDAIPWVRCASGNVLLYFCLSLFVFGSHSSGSKLTGQLLFRIVEISCPIVTVDGHLHMFSLEKSRSTILKILFRTWAAFAAA